MLLLFDHETKHGSTPKFLVLVYSYLLCKGFILQQTAYVITSEEQKGKRTAFTDWWWMQDNEQRGDLVV